MNPPPLLGLCLQVGVVLFIEDLAKCIFTELSIKISGRVPSISRKESIDCTLI
jgi:hypothetical protein